MKLLTLIAPALAFAIGLLILIAPALAFAIGFSLGRYPITERKFFRLWARRHEAMRRDYLK